eukprot:TRINITY_DN7414_c0_g1_i2.p2 TRINITY_DN7414_c0_g1~~TRINITY_DN7414_c0_g1_i2.p2  ORF type:complete len:169 (-),score=42.13 TRINITY_DN7414_c0_g1_i2:37-543(-)
MLLILKGCGTVEAGDDLMVEVYEKLFVNSEFVNNTLLLITYDEHGGYWDHKTPPNLPKKQLNPYHPEEWTTHFYNPEFKFDRVGISVPTILISSWFDPGVDHTFYDHASVPKTVIDHFRLKANSPTGYLTNRDEYANNFLQHQEYLNEPRTDHSDILRMIKQLKLKHV